MAAEKSKRTFIAIKIPKVYEIADILAQAKDQIHDVKIKWTDIANMHLTLKFLGDTPISKINLIIDVLKPIINEHNSTQLKFDSIGTFGGNHNPKIIFVGGRENKEIFSIQKNIEQALTPLGLAPEERRFTMHLTLGRIKEAQNVTSINQFIQTAIINNIPLITVENIILYESILHPTGPQYKPISIFPLQNKGYFV